MKQFLQIFLYIDVITMVLAILLQARSVGLSATFGGEGGVFRKKRGVEKVLNTIAIVAAVIFLGLSYFLGFVN